MKISILTTITNPEERQDKWLEALDCYSDLADEIIVVDGHDWYDEKSGKEIGLDHHALFTARSNKFQKVRWLYLEWPCEWNWVELPRHLNAGLERCTGDWVIKMDIDQLFHEDTFEEIRDRLQGLYASIATFQKYSFVLVNKFYQKAEIPIAINKNRFPDIKFGLATDEETDLCYPIRQTEVKIVGDYELPVGKAIPTEEWGRTGVAYYNYDYTFKTKDLAKNEFWRFAKAYQRFFGTWPWGSTKEESFKVFIKMMRGRLERCIYEIKPDAHPKYIQEAVKNITPEQFGYNGWGLLNA